MLESIKGLSNWCCKDYITIYRLWRWRIVKQDESNGDPKFTLTIGLGGKSTSYWKTNRWKFWKWGGICKAYRNPISQYDVERTSFDNKGKAYMAHVVSTTRGGTVWSVDLGVFKEGTITSDNLHGEKCNRLPTQMSGCNIFLSCNLCFRVEEIKME